MRKSPTTKAIVAIKFFSVVLTFLLFDAVTCFAKEALAAKNEWPLLLQEDFEQGFERWKTTDVDKPFWRWEQVTKNGKPNQVLRVLGASTYKPPHRSPASIALLKDVNVGDFELTVKLQSTRKTAGPHRDLCLFWGYQDPSHFYYVHLGAKPDNAACQIFIVNDAPRTKITSKSAKGTPWTDDWHEAKVTRNVSTGLMEVFFDNMDQPLMAASDTTFSWGQVGLGTFDDHGNFDDFHLFGNRISPPSKQRTPSKTEDKTEN